MRKRGRKPIEPTLIGTIATFYELNYLDNRLLWHYYQNNDLEIIKSLRKRKIEAMKRAKDYFKYLHEVWKIEMKEWKKKKEDDY